MDQYPPDDELARRLPHYGQRGTNLWFTKPCLYRGTSIGSPLYTTWEKSRARLLGHWILWSIHGLIREWHFGRSGGIEAERANSCRLQLNLRSFHFEERHGDILWGLSSFHSEERQGDILWGLSPDLLMKHHL